MREQGTDKIPLPPFLFTPKSSQKMPLPVSGVAGVGPHEDVELGVRDEVDTAQISALEASLEGQMSPLGFSCMYVCM